MNKIDLHLHTNISDGLLNPEEVINLCSLNGCSIISVTDHDYVGDYSYLASKYNIEMVNGIEFNTAYNRMHILGYDIQNFQMVNDIMNLLKKKNEIICYKVINMMKEAGYDVSPEKIIEFLYRENLNYHILDKRKLVKYLISKGYAKDVLDAYNKLIGVGKKFYVPNHKISPPDVINLIINSGGFSVLAHPNTLNLPMNELHKLVMELKENGLVGIEIINGKMNIEGVNPYEILADKLGMLISVGSDFHNPEKDKIGVEIDSNLEKKLILSKKRK